MDSNTDWDREEEIRRLFDPDNVTEWLEHSPEEFIALLVSEIRRETDAISAWSKLLDENPQFSAQSFRLNDQEVAATFYTETMMRAARIITRLLDVARAYREQMPKK